MTARHFNASCPDCNRWRCVCAGDGCPDCGEHVNPCACVRAEQALSVAPVVLHECVQPWTPEHVRTGPPPAPIRERLAKLREECAQHLASQGRRL